MGKGPEQGSGGEGLTFDGLPVRRGKEYTQKLAEKILSYRDVDDLLQNAAFDFNRLDKLHGDLAARTGKSREISEERSRAIERLRDAHAKRKMPPKVEREPWDTFGGESGVGRLTLGGRLLSDVEKADKKGD